MCSIKGFQTKDTLFAYVMTIYNMLAINLSTEVMLVFWKQYVSQLKFYIQAFHGFLPLISVSFSEEAGTCGWILQNIRFQPVNCLQKWVQASRVL